MKNLEEIGKFGPWITKVQINGKNYGGEYDASNDRRVLEFISELKKAHGENSKISILECGCLEGGHTIKLSQAFVNSSITAVDARDENLQKAIFHANLHGISNVEFKTVDLETETKIFESNYTAIFCVGLLYHLRNPDKFLARCAKSSQMIWISTVISSENDAIEIEKEIYRGKYYHEPIEHPLSGIRETSFFPSLGSLCNMLLNAG